MVDGASVILYALLTDDMGNTITGQKISFYVNGTLVGFATSNNDGEAMIIFRVNNSMRPAVVPVIGDYGGHTGYPINILNGELNITELTKIPTQSTINVTNSTKVGTNINISGVARMKMKIR
ncbi:hypothetical protein ALNOE001_11710 [Candidatus Methanobinarius endosymbioticus]|uniref:Uncharacterized protein n=1 Tax=Candidatus Methanobinarius endosymbioticus TaxID=2006182 RepID=A0A366MA12_9EURY|nr:hypothetical protein ALNOE001_11710 [Candidatus Methanobinarius endosymbioticus]